MCDISWSVGHTCSMGVYPSVVFTIVPATKHGNPAAMRSMPEGTDEGVSFWTSLHTGALGSFPSCMSVVSVLMHPGSRSQYITGVARPRSACVMPPTPLNKSRLLSIV